jgi:adenosylcobinamide-GDP ribazoletransferase
MIAPLRRFLSVFTLVSRVPIAVSFEPDYSRSDFWLPLVGAFAAAFALAGAFLGSAVFGDPAFVALCSLLFQYSAFNLFHLDGLMDSADAMMPMVAPERRLEILKDSRIGVYAFFAGCLALALRFISIVRLCGNAGDGPCSLISPNLIAALLSAPIAGRTASAMIPRVSKPARPRGLGAQMKGFSAARISAGFILGLLPLAAWGLLTDQAAIVVVSAAIALASALASGLYFARLYRKKVGGFTGDALGAATEIGELLSILVSAAVLPTLATGLASALAP